MSHELPIGVQSFEELRLGGFAYADKTALVHQLAQSSIPFLLCRPRGFGKSLLLSTLKAYFEGRRDLFSGLAIERLEEESPLAWQARPVFHLDFNGEDYTQPGGLKGRLEALLRGLERRWGSDVLDLGYGPRLERLLELAHEQSGHRVCVLVDEYDRALLEPIHDPVLRERNRAVLTGFLSALKAADEHLRFVLLAGVTGLGRASLSGGLNQLSNLSLSRAFSTICGFTESELGSTFSPELGALADTLDCSPAGCLEALRNHYGRFRFHHASPDVYHPLSLLKALSKGELGSWRLDASSSNVLAAKMRDADLDPKQLVDRLICVTRDRLSVNRSEDPDPVPLLYQTGYLTMRTYDSKVDAYGLAVPNADARRGLLNIL